MGLSRWIDTVLHPDRYHGARRRPPFFEGWYYKLVSADRERRLALIPGLFKHDDPAEAHAFVQVLDGRTGRAWYHRYPISAFEAADDRFEVRIGENFFSADRLRLAIDRPEQRISGEVGCVDVKPWPVTWPAPGIMGWYGWLPFLECYHGVVSLDHSLEGSLVIDSQSLDFAGGRGYTEKDWGQAFPQSWIWLQTNHFGTAGTSLTASIAHIPFLVTSFPGFIVGLLHDGRLTRFTTYTGAEVTRLDVGADRIHWTLRDRAHVLDLRISRAGGTLLRAPTRTQMTERVAETMDGRVHAVLRERASGTVLFEDTGECAGLEVAGSVEQLAPKR